MTIPLVNGRKCPLNDWEGDDFTPGAGGHYVSCADTAVGRMVAYATNGRINKDGRQYRAAVSPPDSGGITLAQAAQAVHSLTSRTLFIPHGWTRLTIMSWLRSGNGLVVNGLYSTIPREYRFQASAGFGHSLFIPSIGSTGSMRLYDPLNRDTTGYGKVVPSSILWPFLASWNNTVAYVPLEPVSLIVWYTVVSGDTLSEIAIRYNLALSALLAFPENAAYRANPGLIHAGDRVRVK